MLALVRSLKARPRLIGATALALAVGLLLPADWRLTTRVLAAWNAGVWTFLALAGWMMLHADHAHLRRAALEHAESASAVLAIVVAAACASVAAIVFELAGSSREWPHLLFGLATVVGAWLLIPALFTMNYASLYHQAKPAGGLRFPDQGASFKPDYADFLYFALTIAVASQTSDVAVASRSIRRLVMAQSVLSFAFNTTILAFTINIAASLFQSRT